jgi:hypothetical protein
MIRARWTLAVLFALAGWGPVGAIHAQESPFKPIETPTLDPGTFKAPNAGLEKTPALDKPGSEQPKPRLPNHVELGKYDLEVTAGHTKDIAVQDGLDSGEAANLSKIMPAAKQDQVLPDYFGVKLSAPVH